jgi:hypothetical protein
LPAPFPPSSTPGVGDPEARRASGQKPGDAVVDVATAGASATAHVPSVPFPRPWPQVGPTAEPRRALRGPRRWQGRPRPRRRAASRLARLSGLATQRYLLSQDWFRGGRRRADSPPAGASRPGSGAVPCRQPFKEPAEVHPGARPPTVRPAGPFLPDADCRPLEAGQDPRGA